MNYMGMVTGHKCRCSDYAEILIEAELVTSGCLRSVLMGRHMLKPCSVSKQSVKSWSGC